MDGAPVVGGDDHHLHGVHGAQQLLVRLHAAAAAQGTQGAAHLVVELVHPTARRQHHPVQHALHAPGDAAMVHGRRQQDAVRLDAGGDDVVDHVVGLDAPEAAGVQTVVAGHAGMDFGAGLEHLELHPGGLHLPPDRLQHLGGVAVLSGTAVDGHDLHKLPLHDLVSPGCAFIIAEVPRRDNPRPGGGRKTSFAGWGKLWYDGDGVIWRPPGAWGCDVPPAAADCN